MSTTGSAANSSPGRDGNPGPPRENALASLALNIALPSIILTTLSREDRLGPLWALLIAISLPIGYAIYDARRRRTLSFFSVVGFISILLTGGLGLLPTRPLWFALKEGSIAIVFGIAIVASHWIGRPLIRQILWNPDIIETDKVEERLAREGHLRAFDRLLFRSSLLIAGGLFFSGIANFLISMHLLRGTIGGTEEYIAAVGTQTWVTWLVIGVPLLGIMILALWRLFKGIESLTGLSMEDILYGEARSVRVSKPQPPSPPNPGDHPPPPP